MSGGLGLGGGKSTETRESSAANTLSALAREFAGETGGVRRGLIDAMQEVLSSGGSTIPIISQAVDSSRQASSRALSETEQKLAQSDLAGTPFGENIIATQRGEGERAAASTKESFAQNIFNMISNFVLGQSQTALGGLAGAIPGDVTTRERGTGWATDVGVGKKR